MTKRYDSNKKRATKKAYVFSDIFRLLKLYFLKFIRIIIFIKITKNIYIYKFIIYTKLYSILSLIFLFYYALYFYII